MTNVQENKYQKEREEERRDQREKYNRKIIYNDGDKGKTKTERNKQPEITQRRIKYNILAPRNISHARNFSLRHCVQTGSGAHPASCPMGTRGSFPGCNMIRA
jgi:hypothetical protein